MARATRRHDHCREHLGDFVRYKLLGRRTLVNQALDKSLQLETVQHNETVRRNRDALKCLIDTTLALSMQETCRAG